MNCSLPSRFRAVISVILLFLVAASLCAAQRNTRVMIRSTGSRESLRAKVKALGGTIQHEFQNVNAVSATIPATALSGLSAIPEFKVRKTTMVLSPRPRDPKGIKGLVPLQSAGYRIFDNDTLIKNAQTLPADYAFNNTLINASAPQAAGNLGQNVVVAVIDSGTANNPTVVPALAGNVIGGENFVTSDPVTSATSTLNGPHGTWVGTMIAAHVGFVFSNTSCLVQSMQANAPDSVQDGTPFGLPGFSIIPMVGVAPAAKIYALKIFPSTGGGAPEDRILAAIDRVITIKKNFLNGQPSVPVSGSGSEDDPFVFDSLNIQVVNMSFGGPTMAAGRDVEDLLVNQLASVGITVAASSGNAGPALLTVGSPATSLAPLSSAATNDPAHERIFWDTAVGCAVPGFGALARPNNTIQTADFSSRGPSADGRLAVDVTTAGYWNFVEGADGNISLVAGTSFSAPTVAGAAALLRGAVPTATATQVRNAIALGANFHKLGDKSGLVEQGFGFLDVSKSLSLLQHHLSPNFLPPFLPVTGDVGLNALRFGILPLPLIPGLPLNLKANGLLPGETKEFLVRIDPEIRSVQVDLASVTPNSPPDQQNQVFGDDLIFAVHQGKTSAFGEGDYPIHDFFSAPATFTIDYPETGYMRVVLLGDWTNAGKISGTVRLTATREGRANFKRQAKISEGELQSIPFTVPAGLTQATFELTWLNDWGHYPTNDLDLILVDPDGNLNIDGATENGRELAIVKNPKPGTWTILVDGFNVFGKLANDGSESGPKTDRYRLQVFEQ